MIVVFAAILNGGAIAVAGVALALGAAVAGLMFRGAAEAWRSERDAAVDRAERLENDVIPGLEQRVTDLEAELERAKLTNVEHLAAQTHTEHAEIVNALGALQTEIARNTIATEFLIKQAFPTAVLPVRAAG